MSTTLWITELLASNDQGLDDEDGNASDWVEIHNPTAAQIDLDGWYLTDDADQLDRWRFPVMTIDPGDYLVVFASGKDRVDPANELHTNFQLAAEGEYLALVEPDGTTIAHEYADSYPPQQSDVSYGIDPDNPLGGTYYYPAPTPGAAQGTGLLGWVSEPTFSVERGFYDAELTVVLSTTAPQTALRYTLDGSTPTETGGILYSNPITITGTTTLRALAYRPDYLPSDPITHTYIFTSDVVQQSTLGEAPAGWPDSPVSGQVLNYGMDPDIVGGLYTSQEVIDSLEVIPSISLVTDLDNLLDPNNGIYVHAGAHGDEWERPTSVELIDPNGTAGFQIDAGLRIRGGFSRSSSNPKHAFRLFFRGGYDGSLKFPLFEDEGVSEFSNIDLRTAQNYSWSFQGSGENSFTREVFSRDTQRDMGYAYTRSRYYHLYLNGQYWGLYQTQERSEANFAESYFGGDAAQYDIIKSTGSSGGYTIEATDGTMLAWRELWKLAVELNDQPTTQADNYWTLQGLKPDGSRDPSLPVLLDVNNLVDYMLLIFYTGNTDAPLSAFLGNNNPNNWFGIYDRVRQDRGFQFFAHDGEHTLGVSGSLGKGGYNRTGPYESRNERALLYSNPQFLHQHLMSHPEYRLRFADRAQKQLLAGGTLTTSANRERFLARVDEVAPAILAESARWGDAKLAPSETPYSIPSWQAQIDEVLGIFNDRSEIVLGQLREDDLFPAIAAPIFNQHGGEVAADFPILLANPNTTGATFYTLDGSDPRQIGGGINPNSRLSESTPVTLLAAGSNWRYLDDGSDQGTAWRNPGFDDAVWQSGPAQLGYGDGDEATLLSYGDNASDKHITTYFRSVFPVTDAARMTGLMLRVLRDDGVSVYLNGQEIARSNLPGEPGTPVGHEQLAAQIVGGEEESTFFEFASPANALVDGENTIAVEVHQGSATSSDISFDLELTAFRGQAPIFLKESSTVSARILDEGVWSALAEATFSVETVPATPANLRLTEINYHPPAPTATELAVDPNLDGDDFEFLELRNTGLDRIDLTGVRLTEAVSFDFTGSSLTELAPGDHVLVVEDIAAFEIRYGTGLPVAGQWSGKLANGGELITLTDGADNIIHQFTYDDENGWPTPPDGEGPTLEVIDVDGDYQDPTNWRASTAILGTPGSTPGLAGDADLDGDTDGGDFLAWQRGFGRFTDNATLADGDFDANGNVDSQDLPIWQSALGNTLLPKSAEIGDADLDGDVDGRDFLSWQRGYGRFASGGATLANGDYDADGDVDSVDLSLWQAQWTGTSSERVTESEAGISLALFASAETPADSVQQEAAGWWLSRSQNLDGRPWLPDSQDGEDGNAEAFHWANYDLPLLNRRWQKRGFHSGAKRILDFADDLQLETTGRQARHTMAVDAALDELLATSFHDLMVSFTIRGFA